MPSSFELLWKRAAEQLDVAELQDLRADLAAAQGRSVLDPERAMLAAAIVELDSMIVARLTKRLRDQAEG
ncbi:hypothetical protein [Caulobacter rhizosphaerae]|uniref:hypothetical protein n=1 Tax=Caulobacter rhizosphaerae TaxID=2010972 RepID=UPI0013D3C06B|nr:hypothetical protein [Caulobacter rhizosphaerae]GGL35715.1 hypothetical protein GCM10010983_35890 [Caulobacter rhizosphaerae]